MLKSLSDTALMTRYSTKRSCKPNLRYRETRQRITKIRENIRSYRISRVSKPLTISTKTIEVLCQSASGKPYSEPTLTLNGPKMQVAYKGTYQGRAFSRAVRIDKEVTAKTSKAIVVFGRLRGNVLESGLTLCRRFRYC